MDKDAVCEYTHTHTHTHTLTMEYGSTKKNEIMLFVATWIDLAIIILSEVKSDRERQIPHDIIYMWNLKYNTNEHIYKTKHSEI